MLAGRAGRKLHSRPQYHGRYVALWLFAPAAIFLAVWTSASPALITHQVLTTPAAESLPAFGFERGELLSDSSRVAQGQQTAVRVSGAVQLAKLRSEVHGVASTGVTLCNSMLTPCLI